jgi:hypothetical protein
VSGDIVGVRNSLNFSQYAMPVLLLLLLLLLLLFVIEGLTTSTSLAAARLLGSSYSHCQTTKNTSLYQEKDYDKPCSGRPSTLMSP